MHRCRCLESSSRPGTCDACIGQVHQPTGDAYQAAATALTAMATTLAWWWRNWLLDRFKVISADPDTRAFLNALQARQKGPQR